MAGLGDESIEMSKFGSGLFGFAFVLVVGLMVFVVGKGMTNDAADKAVKQVELIQQSEFTDYDQESVPGTKVKAAMQNFTGKGMAILISTRAMIDGTVNGLPVSDMNWADIQINITDGQGGSQSQIEGSDGTNKDLWCINYNAILDAGEIYSENGVYISTGTFLVDASTGGLEFFNKTSNQKKQGMAEYIPTGAQYQANLIKNVTGEVIGIVFVQLSSNS